MKGVQNASFIYGWAGRQQDPSATPHLFTLSLKTFWDHLLPHLISRNVGTKHGFSAPN